MDTNESIIETIIKRRLLHITTTILWTVLVYKYYMNTRSIVETIAFIPVILLSGEIFAGKYNRWSVTTIVSIVYALLTLMIQLDISVLLAVILVVVTGFYYIFS